MIQILYNNSNGNVACIYNNVCFAVSVVPAVVSVFGVRRLAAGSVAWDVCSAPWDVCSAARNLGSASRDVPASAARVFFLSVVRCLSAVCVSMEKYFEKKREKVWSVW
jgi:hypothetical protein